MIYQDLKNNNIPDSSGVYFFVGNRRKVLYIGKAASLHSRVRSYFGKDVIKTRGEHIVSMVQQAKGVGFIKTDSFLKSPSDPVKTNNHKCCRPRCKTCHIFQETNKITNTHANRTIAIKHTGSCSTNNCIYAITCTKCNLHYIGETQNTLSLRINGHTSDTRLKKKGIETAEHFSLPDHNLNSMKVTILDNNPNWSKSERLHREDFYMCKLKTFEPTGLNKRHCDFVKYFYDYF